VLSILINPDKSGRVVSIEGTGFFVSVDGTFLTADHVIENIVSRQLKNLCPLPAVYIPKSGWIMGAPTFTIDFFFFNVQGCTRDKKLDLAVCKSPRDIKRTMPSGATPVVFETSIQPDGTPIAFTGFPLQHTFPLSSIGTVSGYMMVRDERGPREIVMDKAAWPGASGSPIYLENGKVIGIILLRGIGEGAGRAIGRPSRFIQDVLSSRPQE